ncbi:hypothetical protein EB796_008552 [Bugula neritina]|uniref:Uncharacterized protein n=1 Tax=Bugula neritina TaxID=10212 RepID=A0A7J7K3C5_BUGNE|nr:hypothetical protein EB796_008552 [Bugula neritina]
MLYFMFTLKLFLFWLMFVGILVHFCYENTKLTFISWHRLPLNHLFSKQDERLKRLRELHLKRVIIYVYPNTVICLLIAYVKISDKLCYNTAIHYIIYLLTSSRMFLYCLRMREQLQVIKTVK